MQSIRRFHREIRGADLSDDERLMAPPGLVGAAGNGNVSRSAVNGTFAAAGDAHRAHGENISQAVCEGKRPSCLRVNGSRV